LSKGFTLTLLHTDILDFTLRRPADVILTRHGYYAYFFIMS